MTINRIIDLVSNTSPEVKAAYAARNAQRTVARFSTQPEREGEVCIVGGGPSLADCLEELKWRKSIGQEVWATNNTYAYLVEQGIQPDAHVLLDAREENLSFLHPTEGVTYYLNLCCHPSLFDALEKHKVVMYDLGAAPTGTTVGLKALYLAGFSGFRKFHLIGFDSSYRDAEHHAYPQALNNSEEVHEVTVDGRKFKAAVWMIYQAEEFQHVAVSLAEQGCVITVSGDGLLPHLARRVGSFARVVTAVYDLTVCPPTYDFISFLGEAERHRVAIGAEAIDLIFVPGPVDGFRNDDLPDSVASRVGMLYRVCLGASRLLPSIRNVDLLKVRRPIAGLDIFPVGYMENQSIQHYGSSFFRTAMPVLQASHSAKAHVARCYKKPYVTITLRQSSHWPQRNSNMAEWEKVSEHIKSRGFQVVVVPDSESQQATAFSWDTDLRLALYEGAVVNIGVNNGPMCMLFYADVRYMIFKMVTEGIPWCSPEYFEKIGMLPGPVQDGRGLLIWGEDTATRIISEFDANVIEGKALPQFCSKEIPHQFPNTSRDVMLAQVENNLKRDLPMFLEKAEHSGTALIVGGGPSLKNELAALRRHYERGGHVFATNGTHDWLIERGIIPEFHVMVDARAENAAFVQNPNKEVTYLIGAQCHADVFEALKDHNVVMWVAPIGGIEPLMEACNKPVIIVRGGSTVGMSAIQLAKLWGYRRIRLFGMDSCYNGTHHAYPQPLNDGETVMEVEYAGKKFKCALWMAKQAEHFEVELPKLEAEGIQLYIHGGDGLLSWIQNSSMFNVLPVYKESHGS